MVGTSVIVVSRLACPLDLVSLSLRSLICLPSYHLPPQCHSPLLASCSPSPLQQINNQTKPPIRIRRVPHQIPQRRRKWPRRPMQHHIRPPRIPTTREQRRQPRPQPEPQRLRRFFFSSAPPPRPRPE